MNKNLQNGFILGAALQGKTEAYLPSGENIGDLLVWNGTNWKAKPKWQLFYQPVEYIESTGNQYIKTNYVPQNNDILEIDLQFTGNVSFGNFGVNGCYLGNPITNRFSIGYYKGKFQYGVSLNAVDTNLNADNNRHKFVIDTLNKLFIVDEVIISNISSIDVAQQNFGLFNRINELGNADTAGFTSEKLYSAKIIRDNNIIFDFVPCYNTIENEIGLYETVNHKFYKNDGTGTFVKGEDV